MSIFDPLFDFLATLLNFFFTLWPDGVDYGMAIVMLTIVVLIVAMPLTFKQTKSMIAMQRLQPEVKALQAKYRDDRERLNQEMMALYQSHGVNPLGGCLPLLVQLPLFLVLFNVVRGITRRLTESGLAFGSAGMARGLEQVALQEGEPAGFTAVPVGDFPARNFNPAYLDPGEDMYHALEARNDMPSFGFDLAKSARGALSDGFGTLWPYLVLILIVFVTSIVQQRQIRGRRDPNAAVNAQQELIMKVMPFLLPVFSITFAAAVVLYFVVSNLFRVGQQSIITRQFYSDEAKQKLEQRAAEVAKKRASDPPAERPARGGDAKKKQASKSGGTHGSRRPTSRPPRKRRANDPKNKSTGASADSGDKPVKPQKKSSGRVTPKSDTSPRRRRGK